MPPAIEIRPAASADVPLLVELVREYWAFERIDGFDAGRVTRVLAGFFADAKLGAAWLATTGGQAVGYLLAVYAYSLEHGGLTAEIDELYLRSEARRSGAGRRLLEVSEAEFRRAGCTNVSLQLGRSNDDARRFYTKCGYRPRSGYELLDKMLD